MLARRDAEVARQRVDDILPFWDRATTSDSTPGLADQVLRVACAIDDPRRATALVEPLRLEQLTPKTAPCWLELINRYGLAWCTQTLEHWDSRDANTYEHEPRAKWIAALPAWASPLSKSGQADAVELVRWIAGAQWTWLHRWLGAWLKPPLSSHSLKNIQHAGRPIVGLLATAALADDRALLSTIIERLTTAGGYPITGALSVLRAGAPHDAAALGLEALHADCTRTLTELLATPARAPDDWSITTQLGCKCGLCGRLGQFLRAKTERQLPWPLANDARAHVHQTITSCELPVTHVTQRVGRPYTLVLTKTAALFAREVTARKGYLQDLAWLRACAKPSRKTRSKRP